MADEPLAIPVANLGSKCQVIGKLHAPLGKAITICGEVVNGPFKGFEGGRNLRIRSLQGVATQENIHICVSDFRADRPLPKIALRKTYEMVGYETGGFVGTPDLPKDLARPWIQGVEMYFHTRFMAMRVKEIPAILDSPADFLSRRALIDGVANTEENAAVLQGSGWKIRVDETKRWPPEAEGKQVETDGVYTPTNRENEFKLIDGTWRFIRLEDQVGREVALRSEAVERNGTWTIHYRGRDLAVDNLTNLPGWKPGNNWPPMEIRGVLAKRDPHSDFVLHATSWSPLQELLVPDLPIEADDLEVGLDFDASPTETFSVPTPKVKTKKH